MKKISRKLFISMFSFVLVFIALGTSTFAWFTMGTEASVDGLEINVSSGEALEISLGYNSIGEKVSTLQELQWTSNLSAEAITEAIGGSLRLDAVTTTDGINFFKNEFGVTTEAEDGGDYNKLYVRIPIYFRARLVEETTAVDHTPSVYLVDYNPNATFGNADGQSGTFIVSKGVDFEADFSFTDVGTTAAGTIETGTLRTPGAKIIASASESARLSFIPVVYNSMIENNVGNTENSEMFGSSIMFDFTKEKENGYFTKTSRTHGFVDFYKTMVGCDISSIIAKASDVAPTYVSELSGFAPNSGIPTDNKSLILELTQTGDNTGIYIGKCYMCFWIEGWDADNFDAVLSDQIKVSLAFKLGYKA